MKSFALFDLDDTLLLGDSDSAWGYFLVEQGAVDAALYQKKNKQYSLDYAAGTLNIDEYIQFSVEPLQRHSLEKMQSLRQQFIEEKIKPMISQQARDLVKSHQTAGHTCIMTTATQSFVTQPIASLFNIEHLIATEPEVINGQYTGRIDGTPNFREGKIKRFYQFLDAHGLDLSAIEHLYAYSDSYNDLPLLELAHTPTAVNPDQKLLNHAQQQQWRIIHITKEY